MAVEIVAVFAETINLETVVGVPFSILESTVNEQNIVGTLSSDWL